MSIIQCRTNIKRNFGEYFFFSLLPYSHQYLYVHKKILSSPTSLLHSLYHDCMDRTEFIEDGFLWLSPAFLSPIFTCFLCKVIFTYCRMKSRKGDAKAHAHTPTTRNQPLVKLSLCLKTKYNIMPRVWHRLKSKSYGCESN